jgi:hypothetical protein
MLIYVLDLFDGFGGLKPPKLPLESATELLAHGRWLSPGSSTTKTGRHDIAEILLKVALKHQKSINPKVQTYFNRCH